MAEYIEREVTCGDCIHADVCEEAETLIGFSRENVAYCGMFMSAADVAPVVRCANCVFGYPPMQFDEIWCSYWCGEVEPNGFCFRGARMDGADNG